MFGLAPKQGWFQGKTIFTWSQRYSVSKGFCGPVCDGYTSSELTVADLESNGSSQQLR